MVTRNIQNESNAIPFQDVEVGEFFSYEGSIYFKSASRLQDMSIYILPEDENGRLPQPYGSAKQFSNKTKVFPINTIFDINK